MSTEDWGNPPTASLLTSSAAEVELEDLVKTLTRSLHLPFRAWSNHEEECAAPLQALLQQANAHSDPWARLIGHSLSDYAPSGQVRADSDVLLEAARKLAAALDATTQPEAAGSLPGITLRRAEAASASEHFQVRPNALSALEESFRPVEAAPLSALCGRSAAATASTCGSGAVGGASASPPAAGGGGSSAAPRPAGAGSGGGDALGASERAGSRGRGIASVDRSSALMSSRGGKGGRGVMSSVAMGRPGGSAPTSRLAGGAAAAASAARKPKMRMMDMEEATKSMLASTAPKPKAQGRGAAAGGRGAAAGRGGGAGGGGAGGGGAGRGGKAAAVRATGGGGGSGGGSARGGGAADDPFAGAVVDLPNGLVHYYQDRRKKWTYTTDERGGRLLRGLFSLAAPLIRTVLSQLPDAVASEGRAIYAQKPNLGANGVTWSQDNYGHLGLQAEYLRLKSIQRFTEGWQAMQRAYNAGAFRHLMGDASLGALPLRVSSFGGGPGFEMVAVRAFCEVHLPRAAPVFISLDLATEWAPCAATLGFGFREWNVNDGEGVIRASGYEKIDLAIISYVLYHYMST
jgi:hypothetical protein